MCFEGGLLCLVLGKWGERLWAATAWCRLPALLLGSWPSDCSPAPLVQGNNGQGTLGIGSVPPEGPENSVVPVPVAGNVTFKQLCAGDERVCGLTTQGAVYCFGLFYAQSDGRATAEALPALASPRPPPSLLLAPTSSFLPTQSL